MATPPLLQIFLQEIPDSLFYTLFLPSRCIVSIYSAKGINSLNFYFIMFLNLGYTARDEVYPKNYKTSYLKLCLFLQKVFTHRRETVYDNPRLNTYTTVANIRFHIHTITSCNNFLLISNSKLKLTT